MKARGKRFFNDSFYENGHVKWQVISGNDRIYKGEVVSAELIVADCGSSISLDFDCEEKQHIPKRIAKLDIFISELQNMREALVNANNETKIKKFFY